MATRIVLTADGSHTLLNEMLLVHYHSLHGALQESRHIFIELGLREAFRRYVSRQREEAALMLSEETEHRTDIGVFEMGFGTGLNALLTWLEAEKLRLPVRYVAVEAHPVAADQLKELNYDGLLATDRLTALHNAAWGERVKLSPYFVLEKQAVALQEFETSARFDAVYYDAFAPAAQPELWTRDVFEKIAQWLRPQANLTTYCSKSEVQRNLRAAGFSIEKHPGPARKREVLRAFKQA